MLSMLKVKQTKSRPHTPYRQNHRRQHDILGHLATRNDDQPLYYAVPNEGLRAHILECKNLASHSYTNAINHDGTLSATKTYENVTNYMHTMTQTDQSTEPDKETQKKEEETGIQTMFDSVEDILRLIPGQTQSQNEVVINDNPVSLQIIVQNQEFDQAESDKSKRANILLEKLRKTLS